MEGIIENQGRELTMLTIFTELSAALDALRRHAILCLLIVAVVALALLGRSWLDAHDAQARLEASLAAQQKAVADADQRQSTRDAQLQQSLAQINAIKQKVQTPSQAATALTQALPQLVAGGAAGHTLPSPITIELPQTPATTVNSTGNSTAANAAPSAPAMPGALQGDALTSLKSQIAKLSSPAQLPANQQGTAPPAIIRIPQDDLKPMFDAVEDCQACRAKLAAAQGDLADEQTKFNAVSAERDIALKAAHGTFWTRARHAAKWFLIGAAAGAAATAVASHHP